MLGRFSFVTTERGRSHRRSRYRLVAVTARPGDTQRVVQRRDRALRQDSGPCALMASGVAHRRKGLPCCHAFDRPLGANMKFAAFPPAATVT